MRIDELAVKYRHRNAGICNWQGNQQHISAKVLLYSIDTKALLYGIDKRKNGIFGSNKKDPPPGATEREGKRELQRVLKMHRRDKNEILPGNLAAKMPPDWKA